MVSLDGDRLLRMPDIMRLFAIGRNTVYRRVAAGLLPAPIRWTSRCLVWKASEIHTCIASLAAGITRRE